MVDEGVDAAAEEVEVLSDELLDVDDDDSDVLVLDSLDDGVLLDDFDELRLSVL